MYKFFSSIEKALYRIRRILWNLPNFLFDDSNYYRHAVIRVYKASSPYSHFVSAVALMSLLTLFVLFGSVASIFGKNTDSLREAVVVGFSETGEVQQLNSVNPIVTSNIQLEKDLVELIYEPLIRYELVEQPDGSFIAGATPILANRVSKIRTGSDYQFKLREDVFWHDGEQFTAADVAHTLELYSELDGNNAYVQAINQLQWEVSGDFSITICTKVGDDFEPCGNPSVERPILSNFLELISVKILPEHLTDNLSSDNIEDSRGDIFVKPIGTGKYVLESVRSNTISLTKNENYHDDFDNWDIERIEFFLYGNLETAVRAIQNGEVHSLASVSTEFKKSLDKYPNLNADLSPLLDSQYWGIHFNLKKDIDGESFSKSFFADREIRLALTNAINKQFIQEEVLGESAAEAFGPISNRSEFFNSEAKWPGYDPEGAVKVLHEKGWTIKEGDTYRTNDEGEVMSFSLAFVDSYDRKNVAESIKADLEKIGVELIIDRRQQSGQDSSTGAPDAWSLSELNEQLLAPRTFDTILYGMETFIDPDRYELFHSSQSNHPNLNIMSYVGEDKTIVAIPIAERVDGEDTKEVSKVDRILETTRNLDPDEKQTRKEQYDEFQFLLAEDSPVIFLYNPKFIYYSHDELSNVTLENASSFEDRFRNIQDWSLSK